MLYFACGREGLPWRKGARGLQCKGARSGDCTRAARFCRVQLAHFRRCIGIQWVNVETNIYHQYCMTIEDSNTIILRV